MRLTWDQSHTQQKLKVEIRNLEQRIVDVDGVLAMLAVSRLVDQNGTHYWFWIETEQKFFQNEALKCRLFLIF